VRALAALIDETRINKREEVGSNEFPGFAHALGKIRDGDLTRWA